MTHADGVAIAVRWLRNQKRCSFVLAESYTGGEGEIPDAIGWKHARESYLIEVKVSKKDFYADKLKAFRCDPAKGMGLYRYLMVPEGLVTVDEVKRRCAGWGLLLIMPRGVRLALKPERQMAHSETSEIEQLVSSLRRVQYRLEEPLHTWLRWDEPGSPFRNQRERMKRDREDAKRLRTKQLAEKTNTEVMV